MSPLHWKYVLFALLLIVGGSIYFSLNHCVITLRLILLVIFSQSLFLPRKSSYLLCLFSFQFYVISNLQLMFFYQVFYDGSSKIFYRNSTQISFGILTLILNGRRCDCFVSLLYIIYPCNDFYWWSYICTIMNISVHWRGSISRIETFVYVIC